MILSSIFGVVLFTLTQLSSPNPAVSPNLILPFYHDTLPFLQALDNVEYIYEELEIELTGKLFEEVDVYQKIMPQNEYQKQRSEHDYYILKYDNDILIDLKISDRGILSFINPEYVVAKTVIHAVAVEK